MARALHRRIAKIEAKVRPRVITSSIVTVDQWGDARAERTALARYCRQKDHARRVIIAPPMAASIEAWAESARAWLVSNPPIRPPSEPQTDPTRLR